MLIKKKKTAQSHFFFPAYMYLQNTENDCIWVVLFGAVSAQSRLSIQQIG